MEIPPGKKIILFDGVCNLCNAAVQRVIRNDRGDVFRLAPLQGPTAKELTRDRGIDTAEVDSIILIDPGVAYYVKSDAALEIARDLRGYGWLPILTGWIPRVLRDWVYDLVARNRYGWFGRTSDCMVPTPEVRGKFLE
ncbi:thiol-disulfide oxidoreductase DCC family protein [Robiginitalea sp. SC105]|uniref:thiol-disulfide oxidoreductase DCC family protein n=1 Tax=Robiginitalea sp. SC105 TaxID=2762332 RepID=UPI00163A7F1B|nr:DCC1-like thiol-disulfide oxidoreductase family protein [Robiginitalea sp. SC105]MBC2840505.1 DUF393 domain-containing protein [Robiginitalea sp. SC105]